ncbi:MAG: hypothetical protein V3V02_02800 [Rhizobiaceae bacterium]
MRIFKIALGAISTLLAFNPAVVNAEQISKVRQAAIEQMQGRLGAIRGSIKPSTEHIFLTEAMIEQLKPIRLAVPQVKATPEIAANDIDVAAEHPQGKTSRQLAEEIYTAVDLKTIDRTMITNSVAGTLPETADIEELERAVDRMLSDNQ